MCVGLIQNQSQNIVELNLLAHSEYVLDSFRKNRTQIHDDVSHWV